MRNFYASSAPAPLDQADGLRRLFAGRRCQVLALVANPHVPFGGLVLDRLASVMASQGRQVLVVDAASTSPQPHELAGVDLSACIEAVAPGVRYLPAKGMPLQYVDARGRSGAFIDAVQQAAHQSTPAGGPTTDVVLLHADAADLVRLLPRLTSRLIPSSVPSSFPSSVPSFSLNSGMSGDAHAEHTIRPMLLGADHPESVKHAYANTKLLAQRCGLLSFDLILVAAASSPRADSISHSLADCVEKFLDGEVRSTVLIDPAVTTAATPAARRATDANLLRLLTAQLSTHSGASEDSMTTAFAPANARFAPEDDDHWVPPRRPSHAAVRAAAQRNAEQIAEHRAQQNAQQNTQHIDRGPRARSGLSSSTAF
jgi:hypothetical protein